MHGHGVGLPGDEVIESHLFRRFSAGGGGTTIADLSTWDSRPDGSVNGDYGLGPNGVVYRWVAASSMWVRAQFHSSTFTQVGATLGASITPTGWAATFGTSNITTDGTVLSIGSATASVQAEFAIGLSASADVYYSGYMHMTNVSGSASGVAGGTLQDDGARRISLGTDTSTRAIFSTSAGTATVGGTSLDSWASRVWVEYWAPFGAQATAWIGHSKDPVAFSGYAQSSTLSGTPTFRCSDRPTAAAAITLYEQFQLFEVT